MKTKNLFLSIAASLGLVMQSHAVVISGGGLQAALDNITVGGSSGINVQTDQVINDDIWAISAASGSVSTLMVEMTGFAYTNSFGIYDISNPANFVELLDGPSDPGAQTLVNIMDDGQVRVNFVDTGTFFASNMFGFYIDVPGMGSRWYSETSLNADGTDHMAAFAGNDSDVLQLPGFAPGLWQSTEYILAFEDMLNGGDSDYDDFVAIVASIVPVPEPGSLALLALALAGIGFSRRRA